MPDEESIDRDVASAVGGKGYDPQNTELAFFGGSFTAIDKNIYENYLKIGKKYIDGGLISGIRFSTRPDSIDRDVLDTCKKYGVTAIELGAQSMDDGVLSKNFRGHTAKDVENAAKLITKYGFETGLQMMTGLYFDTPEKSMMTARKIAALSPDTVRIYPTLVLKNTYLEELYLKGEYSPETVDEAATLSAKLIQLFEERGITVIRVGLHDIDKENFVAGPWHPAFGEITKSRIMKQKTEELLKNLPQGEYTVTVAPKDVSKFVGQKKENIKYFKNAGYTLRVIPDGSCEEYQVRIKEQE